MHRKLCHITVVLCDFEVIDSPLIGFSPYFSYGKQEEGFTLLPPLEIASPADKVVIILSHKKRREVSQAYQEKPQALSHFKRGGHKRLMPRRVFCSIGLPIAVKKRPGYFFRRSYYPRRYPFVLS